MADNVMQTVVIDTNVVVSSNISPNGKPSKIMELFYTNKVVLLYSDEILAEYIRVLSYKKLNIAPKHQTDIINAIVAGGTKIVPITSNIPLPHEDDRMFYDTAKSGNAFLVTGNVQHYPSEPFIMTPSDFLAQRES